MINVRPATLDEIRANWDFFEHGINTVIQKTSGGFIAADIYASISAKGLFLYWIIDEGETVGFTILSEAATSYDGKKALYLDHTYIDPKLTRSGMMEDLDVALEDLAVKCDCSRLEFNSPRMGWGRRLRRMGWEPLTVVYKRDL